MGNLRTFIWPNWQQRKRLLRKEAWLVVAAAYPLLIFAWLWPQDWRNESTGVVFAGWMAFLIRTVQFHLALLLAFIVAVALLIRARRLALAAVVPMLFTLVPAAMQFLPRPAPPTAIGKPLRIMSVNLLMANEDTDGIIEEIIAASPDVVFLQEYTPHWHQAVERRLGVDYPYESHIARDDSFGIAIRSRTPFAGPVDDRFRLGNSGVDQQRASIEFDGREYALYHIHLLPPRSFDYYKDQRIQFADLLDALAAEKKSYIVCGDFNFSETTPQHRQFMAAGIGEAHAQSATGRGATWPVNGVMRYITPGIRIDHVYLSSDLWATKCQTGIGRGSDHRPVVVDVVGTAAARPSTSQTVPFAAHSLEGLEAMLKKHCDDPDAPTRVRALIDSLASGASLPDQIDGVPVAAIALPGWWLRSKDVCELTVLSLGKRDADYDLSIFEQGKQVAELKAIVPTTNRATVGQFWLHTTQVQVDRHWRVVDPSPQDMNSADIYADEQAFQSVVRRFEAEKQRIQPFEVGVGKNKIRLTISSMPKRP
ncbi:endonuclease/exonuclease/phosphatase family protein [Humisphaera borealis]|uniref:Endonuclease/exonuclease/phosphatase family protein n=1 Tax=Humisphaera borealis TaxID=2807512 RepID=A0A7M2WR84_9BACT|nr:endonuclease/exonuclease/phosphatase family protein [Humisphaera borealis]QOV87754.1 endonuclease/exonuclease/phosphatase family protein [Humisphaera borealis]